MAKGLLLRGALFGMALSVLGLSFDAVAQTTPAAPTPAPTAQPPAPAPGAQPSDPAAPPSTTPPPAPAEPTAPAEPPPPVAESPMLAEEPPPTPPPPPPPPPEDEPADSGGDDSAGPFSKGSIRLTLLVGTGSTIDDTYLILGGGPGYFIVDGLEIGLDYEAWIFAEPVMHRLSPETRYVFHMIPVIKPYIGVFYRHTFVPDDRYDDFDHVGARGGLYYVPKGGRVFVGGGAIYERLLDCEEGALLDCDEVYPEIFVGVSI